MEFGVLGPVQVRSGERTVPVGAARPRCVLGLLALDAGRVVSTERLVEALWGDDPPPGTANAIQAAVSRLRRVLNDAGADAEIVKRGHGYLLDVDPERVDVHRFRGLVTRARRLGADEVAEAEGLLAAAQRLWRGQPLADVDSDLVRQTIAPALARERLDAQLDHNDLVLALGEHVRLVHELTELVQDHPYEQRLSGQLMLALSRSGRPADALEEYQRLRRCLDEELGLEPDAGLRRLQTDILRADPVLDLPAETGQRARPEPTLPPPAQLPPVAGDFVGREEQLAWLLDRVRGDQGEPNTVVISALAGQGGVGKTALALRAAHLLSDGFRDGQLYVNLRGAQAEPVLPAQALVSFLVALGVPGEQIPDATEDRAALFRSRLAGRRVLIVLDDAANEAQIRPLLPGTSTCAVLVTSRKALVGLEQAAGIRLDVLSTDQAVQLIRRVVGRQRVDAEPWAVRDIVRLCGGLPLAVRIVAARLAARPDLRLARMAARLSDEHRRLDELVAGDLAVRASLALSYQALTARQRQALRSLSLFGIPDFDAWLCAAMLDITMPEAEHLLDALVDVHLLEVSRVDAVGRPRYRFHDLTRLFAQELAARQDDEQARGAAVTRALGAWLALAEEAGERLGYQGVEYLRGTADRHPVDRRTADELLVDPLAWFDSEHACLVAVIRQAGERARGKPFWELAQAAGGYLAVRELRDDWQAGHRAALAACRRSGDPLGEAVMLRGLAESELRHDPRTSLNHAAEARDLFRDLGERRGQADAARLHGAALRLLGHHDEARESLHAATELGGESAPVSTTRALLTLANMLWHDGRAAESGPWLRAAEQLGRRRGQPFGEAYALLMAAHALESEERWAESAAALERALEIWRVTHHRPTLAMVLVFLACDYARLGDARADELLDEAVRLSRGPDEPTLSSKALGAFNRAQFIHRDFVRFGELLAERVRRDLADRTRLVSEIFLGLGDARRARVLDGPTCRQDVVELCRSLGRTVAANDQPGTVTGAGRRRSA